MGAEQYDAIDLTGLRRDACVTGGSSSHAAAHYRNALRAIPSEIAHCRQHIASYKVPRELHVVQQLRRSPSGKPDYPWAQEVARAGQYRV